MLPGIIANPGAVSAVSLPSYSFLGSGSSSAGASAYSFSITVPASTETQYLIVGVGGMSAATRTISSVVWNAISGSQKIRLEATSFATAALYIITVPPLGSNTTANVTVTFSAAMVRANCMVWSAKKLRSLTPVATASSGASPASMALNSVPAGALMFGVTLGYQTGAYTWTWTVLTKDLDAVIGSTQARQSGASLQTLSGGNFTITATPSNTVNPYSSVAMALR